RTVTEESETSRGHAYGMMIHKSCNMRRSKQVFILFMTSLLVGVYQQLPAKNKRDDDGHLVSIQQFGVKPGNTAKENAANLQNAIDWASDNGAGLYVEPSDEPYHIDGGIVLKKNLSLIGVHGPTARGTVHSSKKQPVGSVFQTTDRDHVFITVESATKIKGIQY